MPTVMNVYKGAPCNVKELSKAGAQPRGTLEFAKAVGFSAATSAASAATSAVSTATSAVSTTASAVSTAPSAAAAAAAAAGSAFLGLADPEGTPSHVLAIKAADGGFPLFPAIQGYKGKPAGAPGFTIHGNMEVNGSTKVVEERTNFVLGSREGQIAHVEFHLFVWNSTLN